MTEKVTELIGWLYDVERMLDWRVSPLDILLCEKQYPGVIYNLGIEAWQQRLVEEQIATEDAAQSDKEVDGQGER